MVLHNCTHVNLKIFVDFMEIFCRISVMYIDIVPNRNSPPAVLLRESVREGGKVVKKTVGNLTGLSPEKIAAVRLALSGRAQVPAESLVEVLKSRPHGHVKAVKLAMEKLGMAGLVSSTP